MRGRTVILVSHHVQLCTPGANYVVALDNGRLQFQGSREDFQTSDIIKTLSQSSGADPADEKEEAVVLAVEDIVEQVGERSSNDSETASTAANTVVDSPVSKPEQKKAPRKLVEEEKRAVGRIGKEIWATYIGAAGGPLYWSIFGASLVLAAASPLL